MATQNRPLAGNWNANPGNWRTNADAKQPNHRSSVAKRSTIGISGRVALELVRGHRHTLDPKDDPMLAEPVVGQKAARTAANAARKAR